MRSRATIATVGSLLLGSSMWLWADTATGQVSVRRRPLGGYGAATIGRSLRTEMGGGAYIPYAGGFGGYIAQRALEPMPPGSPVVVPSPARTTIGGAGMTRTPIGGASRMMGRRFPTLGGPSDMNGPIRSQAVGMPGVMPPRLVSPFGAPSVLGGG